jgi:hypothetical protein
MAKKATTSDTTETVVRQLAAIVDQLKRIHHEHTPILTASGPERLLVRVSMGKGTVRQGVDGRTYFVVHGKLYDLDRSDEGLHEAVYETKAFTTFDLFNYAPPARWPFDRPNRPDEQEWLPPMNPTKSRWVLRGEGNELYAMGPALSRIAITATGGAQFWYSLTAFVTGGRGEYEGAIGQATSLGSSYFESVPRLDEAFEFDLSVVHVFKVLLRQGRAPAP